MLSNKLIMLCNFRIRRRKEERLKGLEQKMKEKHEKLKEVEKNPAIELSIRYRCYLRFICHCATALTECLDMLLLIYTSGSQIFHIRPLFIFLENVIPAHFLFK